MPKQRKLADPEIRAKVEEALKTKTRNEVCKEFGLDYAMIRREFGNAWTHGPVAVTETTVAEPETVQ